MMSPSLEKSLAEYRSSRFSFRSNFFFLRVLDDDRSNRLVESNKLPRMVIIVYG